MKAKGPSAAQHKVAARLDPPNVPLTGLAGETTRDEVAWERLGNARSRFLTRNPFLGVVALGMGWVESSTVRYVTSDGRDVYYNPEFVRTAAPLVLEGHLLHSVLHWALGHPWRGQGVDARTWQSATDLSLVELFLRSAYDYRAVLPLKASVEYSRGRSAEEIARLLPPPESTEGEERTITTEVDECWQEPAGEGESGRELRQRWRERLVRAAQSMAYAGEDPGGADALLGALGRPRIDWRAELSVFLQRTYAADFSWIPPNRRYLSRGIYLPGTRSRNIGDLVVALDTSGSIDPDSAHRFLTEVLGISQMVGGSGRLILVQADDRIRDVRELRLGEKLPMIVHGRGGTDFRPVFEFARRTARFLVRGVIYLTDGEGEFPDRPPGFPVIWAMPERRTVPFGRCVGVPFL